MAEEGHMISSPCENCHRKNLPKENCADDCEILNAIQLYQVSKERDFFISAIDYSEEGRFCLNSKDIMI
jgi:uncharacterized OB-fold protein